MFSLNTSYSDAACEVTLNPFAGTAKVWFWQGGCYNFSNVSRREIVKAIAIDLVSGGLPSVGQWLHANCINR
jgi:hypothetical protein